MAPRMVLNAVYAMLVDGLNSEQRDEFDASLYGLDEKNKQGNKVLFGIGGGGDG